MNLGSLASCSYTQKFELFTHGLLLRVLLFLTISYLGASKIRGTPKWIVNRAL